jgi:hypothetical protein
LEKCPTFPIPDKGANPHPMVAVAIRAYHRVGIGFGPVETLLELLRHLCESPDLSLLLQEIVLKNFHYLLPRITYALYRMLIIPKNFWIFNKIRHTLPWVYTS